ncbi:unnamed protein product [Urochloa decumbens]|uniref:PGG domain-containing protein n=1 Tax=Urochloa decumbens TaxID=240449 RepID=A0ABC9E524_9POAL
MAVAVGSEPVVPAPEAPPTPAAAANARPLGTLDPQLLRAARRGDTERLKELLHVHLEDEEQGTRMTLAAAQDDTTQAVPRLDGGAFAPPPSSAAATGDAAVIVEVGPPRLSVAPGGVTIEGDSLLHVLAACGDGQEFVRCAKMIVRDKECKQGGAAAKLQVLQAQNNQGDTPLHCAAGAGNAEMVSCLVDLAGEGGERAVKDLLRKQNHCGETALHKAVRAAQNNKACADKLLSRDSELARIPPGASPLYLAVWLGEMEIARHLLDKSRGNLSYSGPHGQNVLHAAVSCGKAAAALPVVLDWLKDPGTVGMEQAQTGRLLSQLTSQRDKKHGSTPLHLAASSFVLPSSMLIRKRSTWPGPLPATKLLLDANVFAIYQPDNEGMYPIHVAASAGCLDTVKTLLDRCPDCATLRDGKGRTLLHVAVEKGMLGVVHYVCSRLSSILNVQDHNGDTALHSAVHAGHYSVFNTLIWNQQVRFDLANNKGMRPIDLSWSMMPSQTFFSWDHRVKIRRSLLIVGAPYGESRGDLFGRKHVLSKKDEDKISQNLTDAAQVLAIFSVLITTATFASAFTLPGGYRSLSDGGSGVAGTPVLARSYAFDAFIVSDALAFGCSLYATFLPLYSGAPAQSLESRFIDINCAYSFMVNSGRILVTAFGLGLYVVLQPVSIMISAAIVVATVFLALRLVTESEGTLSTGAIRLIQPQSIRDKVFVWTVWTWERFWPYILIFGLPADLLLNKLSTYACRRWPHWWPHIHAC